MFIKTRRTLALLYRSAWVAKGTCGNSHGYSVQHYVGSLPLESIEVPTDLAALLTSEEVAAVDFKVCTPVRLAAEEAKRTAERREADPIWRLEEAARLIAEAATRSEKGVVPDSKLAAIQTAMAAVKSVSQFRPAVALQPTPIAAKTAVTTTTERVDSLRDALDAINAARVAVLAGSYGSAPKEGVRTTYAYKKWADILQAVTGTTGDSLMRALQTRGFAKTRGK
jgi:hypothetical protein